MQASLESRALGARQAALDPFGTGLLKHSLDVFLEGMNRGHLPSSADALKFAAPTAFLVSGTS